MKEFKLISMTAFVLAQNYTTTLDMSQIDFYDRELSILSKIRNYAKFLKQPLKLEMFVPVDQNGNVLSEPQMIEKRLGFDEVEMDYDYAEVEIYKKAKEKVLFKNVTITPVEDYYIVKIGRREVWITWTERTIEDIQHINRAYEVDFELTESAIKQLGL